MNVVRTTADLREALRPARRAEQTVGLVPTMGALHPGHLSLIDAARAACEVVVVSLFVNPTQFDDAADLDRYPRTEDRDATLVAEHGGDILFAPAPEDVYPEGFATSVAVAGLTEPLEGVHRGAAHFAGVTTVVAKLLNMVGPQVAFFGQKDAQQALVVQRMARDLDFPVRIEVCPTVREPDGLAMSSRNVHLGADDRRRAASLHRALDRAQAAIDAGERDGTAVRASALGELDAAGVTPEYLEIVAPQTLVPVGEIDADVLAVVAARVGATRLIDNQLLRVPVGAELTPRNHNGRS